MHSKVTQDPNVKGVRGKFAADELFAAGIDGIVGPLDVQYIRAMYNEHCLNAEASKQFTAWNAGHEIKTTPEREWLFVVGRDGLDKSSWTFDVERAEPVVEEGMMVEGRNAEKLAALLRSPEVERSHVTVAEIVALRLYTGPMYVKYHLQLHRASDLLRAAQAQPSLRTTQGDEAVSRQRGDGAAEQLSRARRVGLRRRDGAGNHVGDARPQRGAWLLGHRQGQGSPDPVSATHECALPFSFFAPVSGSPLRSACQLLLKC